MGDYASLTNNDILTLTTNKVNTIGNNQLIINITNAQTSITATTNMTFVSSSQIGLCDIPKVDILNKSILFYDPSVYRRSQMIVISSSTDLNCSSGLGNFKQWFVFVNFFLNKIF